MQLPTALLSDGEAALGWIALGIACPECGYGGAGGTRCLVAYSLYCGYCHDLITDAFDLSRSSGA